MGNIKILISYHKKDTLISNDILLPINAGRTFSTGKKDHDWLVNNCIGDDTGVNISHKNKTYNELTSIYWAWKNFDELGRPDYIGHFHYRRHLGFCDCEKSVIEAGNINDDYINTYLQSDKIINLCKKYDAVFPKPQFRASAYEHYRRNFDINDLDETIKILSELFPEYYDSAIKYLQGNELYFCNIFLMKKELFFKYCNYIFTILEEVEKRLDFTNKRMYISEWLTGIFVQKLIDENASLIAFLPTIVAQAPITIPIAISFDHNYTIQAGVMLTSLLENAFDYTTYDVRCLIDESVTDKDKRNIYSILDRYERHSVKFIDSKIDVFDDVQINTTHLSKSSFSRLLIADLINDVDKIIYLDVDTIVCKDLTILYRYSLDENIVAGVRAPGYYSPESWKNEKLKELDIPGIDSYINAGVLIMDLNKIRTEKLVNKFIECSKNNYRSEDQDIINKVCYGRIRILPFRYNVQTKYFDEKTNEKTKLVGVIPNDEIIEAQNDPVVIHYANPIKPWHELRGYLANAWLDYAHLSGLDLSDVHSEKLYQSQIRGEQIDSFIKGIKKANYCTIIDSDCIEKYCVSIIIPCYNAEKTINETIKSCILQEINGITIEIICVDDGSSDATLSILKQWGEKYRNITVLTQKNQGSGKARNLGMLLAKGEYIAFMDADDYYPSATVMDNLYNTARKNAVCIAGGAMTSFDGKKVNAKYAFPLDGYVFSDRSKLNYSDYQFDFGYTRFIYKKSFLQQNNISFPDYLRYQDPPFFVEAMIKAGEFMAVKEPTYTYRVAHKEVKWDERKLCDLIHGISDVLKISQNNNYSHLHYLAYLRFLTYLTIFKKYISDRSLPIILALQELIGTIDFQMVSDENQTYGSADIVDISGLFSELFVLHKDDVVPNANNSVLLSNDDELQKKVDELNFIISETRKSFSYRLGLFMTFVPRKIREIFAK